MYMRSTRTHTTDSVPYSEASADDHRPVRVLLHSSLVVAVLLALEHGAENDLTHSPPNPHQPLLPSQECTLQFTTFVLLGPHNVKTHISHLTPCTHIPHNMHSHISLTSHTHCHTLIAIMPHITTTMLPSDNSLMHHPLLFCVTAIAQPSAIMG